VDGIRWIGLGFDVDPSEILGGLALTDLPYPLGP
jgi:hypothetical protein